MTTKRPTLDEIAKRKLRAKIPEAAIRDLEARLLLVESIAREHDDSPALSPDLSARQRADLRDLRAWIVEGRKTIRRCNDSKASSRLCYQALREGKLPVDPEYLARAAAEGYVAATGGEYLTQRPVIPTEESAFATFLYATVLEAKAYELKGDCPRNPWAGLGWHLDRLDELLGSLDLDPEHPGRPRRSARDLILDGVADVLDSYRVKLTSYSEGAFGQAAGAVLEAVAVSTEGLAHALKQAMSRRVQQ